MKQYNITVFFILILCSWLNTAFSQKLSRDTTTCLFVKGYINSENEQLSNVTVKVYCGNKIIDSLQTRKNNFASYLNKNCHYTVQVMRDGYYTKLVSINTTLPKEVFIQPLFEFIFDMEFFTERKNIDTYFLDFPAALISYNSKNDAFEMSRKYNDHIREKTIPLLEPATMANN